MKGLAKLFTEKRFSAMEIILASGVMYAASLHMYKFAVVWAIGWVAVMIVLAIIQHAK